ncbi:hypothetical protein LR48_Vigan07g061800 [Vigna angularis]|uniref:Uncharacterized protein n=1 Tax=Phaseolus angularis TaxID=3914 RepID=A0A0L9UWJ8_PHAAN|nr:hypothetical protein LR48_Vigan07g061800 [Vigna angularis]
MRSSFPTVAEAVRPNSDCSSFLTVAESVRPSPLLLRPFVQTVQPFVLPHCCSTVRPHPYATVRHLHCSTVRHFGSLGRSSSSSTVRSSSNVHYSTVRPFVHFGRSSSPSTVQPLMFTVRSLCLLSVRLFCVMRVRSLN